MQSATCRTFLESPFCFASFFAGFFRTGTFFMTCWELRFTKKLPQCEGCVSVKCCTSFRPEKRVACSEVQSKGAACRTLLESPFCFTSFFAGFRTGTFFMNCWQQRMCAVVALRPRFNHSGPSHGTVTMTFQSVVCCVQGSPKQRAAIGAKAVDGSGFLFFTSSLQLCIEKRRPK